MAPSTVTPVGFTVTHSVQARERDSYCFGFVAAEEMRGREWEGVVELIPVGSEGMEYVVLPHESFQEVTHLVKMLADQRIIGRLCFPLMGGKRGEGEVRLLPLVVG